MRYQKRSCWAGVCTDRDLEEADRKMANYANGEDAAFPTVYRTVEPRLRAYLSRLERNKSHIDDLIQQTFLNMIRARGTFIPGAEVFPWARKIAERVFYSASKSKRPEVFLDEVSDEALLRFAPRSESEDKATARETAAGIGAAYRRLPARQRLVLDEIVGHGSSNREVAHILRTTALAVKLLLHKAKKKLRKGIPT
jgi:RNA polymerase sigma-70 factor (ECF subfamily)